MIYFQIYTYESVITLLLQIIPIPINYPFLKLKFHEETNVNTMTAQKLVAARLRNSVLLTTENRHHDGFDSRIRFLIKNF